MIPILNIKISPEVWASKSDKERKEYIDMLLCSMSPEQQDKMAELGERVIQDDILGRANNRPRNALRTLARAVNVTVEVIPDEASQ